MSVSSSSLLSASVVAAGGGLGYVLWSRQPQTRLRPGDRWLVNQKFSNLYGFDNWNRNHIPARTVAPSFTQLAKLPRRSSEQGITIRVLHQSCLTEWATKNFKTRGWRTRFESVATHVFDPKLDLDIVSFTELGQESAGFMDAAARAEGYQLFGFFCGPKTNESETNENRALLTEPLNKSFEGLGVAIKNTTWSSDAEPRFVPLANGKRHARGAVIIRVTHRSSGSKYAFCVFHLDHLDADQRLQGLTKLTELAAEEQKVGYKFVALGDHNNFLDDRPDDWSVLGKNLTHAVAHPERHFGAPGTMLGWSHKIDKATGVETREWFGRFATSWSSQLGNRSGPLLDAILLDPEYLTKGDLEIEYSAHVPIPARVCRWWECPSQHARTAVEEQDLASDHAGVFLQLVDRHTQPG